MCWMCTLNGLFHFIWYFAYASILCLLNWVMTCIVYHQAVLPDDKVCSFRLRWNPWEFLGFYLVGGFLISYTVNWVVGFLLPFLWHIFPTYLLVPSHFIWLNDNGRFLGDFSQFGSSMTVTFIYFDCHKKNNHLLPPTKAYWVQKIQEMKDFQVVGLFLAKVGPPSFLPSLEVRG